MWYFKFETPEEFLSYQDKIIENWKRLSTYSQSDDEVYQSELYRATGRTTCEEKCVNQLIGRGEIVNYVLVDSSRYDRLKKTATDPLRIIRYSEYLGLRNNFSSSTEKQYYVFDHWIFDYHKYPHIGSVA